MADNILILGGWSIQVHELDPLVNRLPAGSTPTIIDLFDLQASAFNPDASIIERVADKAGSEPWDLVIGWSLGSMMALELALGKKLNTNSLLLFAPCLSFVKTDAYPQGWSVEDVEALADGIEHSLERTLRIFRRRCRALDWTGGSSADTKASLLEGLQYIKHFNQTDNLKRLRIPTTLIQGQCDKIIHPSASEKIHQTVTSATLIRVAGGSHSLCLDEDQPVKKWIQSALQTGK